MLETQLFTATKKPIGWAKDATGKRKRLYAAPQTPYQRLKASRVLSQPQLDEFETLYSSINPAELTRQILTYQDRLISYANDKTLAMAAQIEQKQQARTARQKTGIRTRAS